MDGYFPKVHVAPTIDKHYYIYITYNGSMLIEDKNIAWFLNISYTKYYDLLSKYRAQQTYLSDEYYFEDELDCQKFVDEIITPILVMQQLE